jgi:hypothetical protein
MPPIKNGVPKEVAKETPNHGFGGGLFARLSYSEVLQHEWHLALEREHLIKDFFLLLEFAKRSLPSSDVRCECDGHNRCLFCQVIDLLAYATGKSDSVGEHPRIDLASLKIP